MNRATLVYGGPQPGARLARIRWAKLAQRLALPFAPTLSAASFTRRFPGQSWPRRLTGPEEGNLPSPDREILLSILQSHTYVDRCFFHVWYLSTLDWKEDLLFEAALADAAAFPNKMANVRNTPTHWFPADRSWLVCTDYDLTFTIVAGSKRLAHDLLNNPSLECLAITPGTRVDDDAGAAVP